MSRPTKAVVDYFPHYVSHGKTMFTIEGRFGNDGYAFWFKTLELLGSSENHFINCNDYPTWEFLLAKTRVDEITANNILDVLAKCGSIDSELWRNKIIWSQHFLDNVSTVYLRRKVSVPTKEVVMGLCMQKSNSSVECVNINPQSIVEYSIVDTPIPPKGDSVNDKIPYADILDYLNQKTGSHFRVIDTNRKPIKARFNDGFTLNDFKTVIDKKTIEWLPDEKMSQYLRPKTLFGPKFESYLVAAQRDCVISESPFYPIFDPEVDCL